MNWNGPPYELGEQESAILGLEPDKVIITTLANRIIKTEKTAFARAVQLDMERFDALRTSADSDPAHAMSSAFQTFAEPLHLSHLKLFEQMLAAAQTHADE